MIVRIAAGEAEGFAGRGRNLDTNQKARVKVKGRATARRSLELYAVE